MIFTTGSRRRRGGYGSFGQDPLDTFNTTGVIDTSGPAVADLAPTDTGGSFWSSLPGIFSTGSGLLSTLGIGPGTASPPVYRPPAPRPAGSSILGGMSGNTTTYVLIGGGLLLAMMVLKK